MFRKERCTLSIVLLMISSSLIVWASLPNPRQSFVQIFSPSEMQFPANGQEAPTLGAETRQVTLDWPRSMRIGKEEEITLVFEPVEKTASPLEQLEASNIYNSYNIMAESRFEVAGIRVFPAKPTRESMPVGRTVKFKWQISMDQVGTYDGVVWLSLRFLPLDGNQPIQAPIFIHDVRIHTSGLLGMNETMAYFVGGSGITLGLVIIFGDMIGLVRRRMRKLTTKVG